MTLMAALRNNEHSFITAGSSDPLLELRQLSLMILSAYAAILLQCHSTYNLINLSRDRLNDLVLIQAL